uniref:Uncharacterized protein n=1 Tax=Aegilops tauschii subsp. strangulata TaxID=200361 RepID=A0A453NRC2_AEGTS
MYVQHERVIHPPTPSGRLNPLHSIRPHEYSAGSVHPAPASATCPLGAPRAAPASRLCPSRRLFNSHLLRLFLPYTLRLSSRFPLPPSCHRVLLSPLLLLFFPCRGGDRVRLPSPSPA